ncbi:MAG: DASS family sodium-coupled anion symporter [Armatimonadota bacterium]|jgi:sodium-dependent dicarboxylate transporter 2/3/5
MHRRLVYTITRQRWLVIALLIGAVLLLVHPPHGLTVQGWRVLVIVIVAVLLWVTEAIPLPAVAFVIAFAQVALAGKDPNHVAMSFWSDSVFFIMGSLMLAVAMVKQRLDRRIAFALTRISGPQTKWIALAFLAMSAIIASFIGEHTVAGLMLPVVLVLVNSSGEDEPGRRQLAKMLLFCVAYGCIIGGLGTPSGGARNIIVMGYWHDWFDTDVGYATWMKFTYPIVLLQIPAAFAVVWFGLRPQRRELSAAVAALRRQVAEEGRMGPREWAVVAIFAATLAAWITLSDRIGLGIISLLAATVYLVFGLVDWADYNTGVNWGVVLVYGAAISLGQAMKTTPEVVPGGPQYLAPAEWAAKGTLTQLAGIGVTAPFAILAMFAVVTLLFTNIMSAGATVAVLAPILLAMAQRAGLNPVIAGLVTALSSAYAYLTVFGTPASTIVYGTGHLRTTDFLRLGWRMAIVSTAIVLLIAALYWPHLSIPGPPG